MRREAARATCKDGGAVRSVLHVNTWGAVPVNDDSLAFWSAVAAARGRMLSCRRLCAAVVAWPLACPRRTRALTCTVLRAPNRALSSASQLLDLGPSQGVADISPRSGMRSPCSNYDTHLV